jgi:hypothetical protein
MGEGAAVTRSSGRLAERVAGMALNVYTTDPKNQIFSIQSQKNQILAAI